jgi:hypothetical protein
MQNCDFSLNLIYVPFHNMNFSMNFFELTLEYDVVIRKAYINNILICNNNDIKIINHSNLDGFHIWHISLWTLTHIALCEILFVGTTLPCNWSYKIYIYI